MKVYEAWVTGVVSRRVTVEAKNQEVAEIKAMSEFSALVGSDMDSNVEVVNLERINDREMTPVEIRNFYDRYKPRT